MRCIIVDDEAASQAIIAHLVNQVSSLELLGQFSNAIEAIKFLNKNEVDLVFLDIHMPDFTGFDFIDTLKEPPAIVLITSDRNFAIEAFEYSCIVDYLVKPVELSRFQKAVDKVVARATANTSNPASSASTVSDDKEQADELYVNIDRRLIKIGFKSIKLVEAKGDYVLIMTDEKNLMVHSSLKKVEEKLPDDLFLKIHRSYIINIRRIIDIEDNSVLIDREVVPVSRSKRPVLLERLNLL